jgi:hypothetical protein
MSLIPTIVEKNAFEGSIYHIKNNKVVKQNKIELE